MQTHVILSNEDAAWLDEQCAGARRTRGATLNRSKLLRGIVTGLSRGNADLSRCATEDEVAALLTFYLDVAGRSGRNSRGIRTELNSGLR